MIYIDLPADLNLEDDEGRNIARLTDAVTADTVTPGAVLVAGAPRAWSWAVVEDVDSGVISRRAAGIGACQGCAVPRNEGGSRARQSERVSREPVCDRDRG